MLYVVNHNGGMYAGSLEECLDYASTILTSFGGSVSIRKQIHVGAIV